MLSQTFGAEYPDRCGVRFRNTSYLLRASRTRLAAFPEVH